ncbi:MAG: hypothetical protein KJ757_02440 [Planctomycetes bacterium]|nr:hypothetical protein [Planctomycetota bacterium]MBU1518441.1 hypothetical protein [Planctomycetota bacterium]MBU2458041.1 hypothetical protein [Planctomycetota bacterium]MBU2596410.1 hypothetical protein [Planctomycetota bacterium]
MKKTGWILAILIIPIMTGCQPAQQQKTADISRKDRLVANENLNLKNQLKQCQKEIEKQKTLLEQCRRENLKIQTDAGSTATFLMDQLPKDLMEEVERLTQENERLKAEIEGLQKAEKVQADANGLQAR